MSKYANAGDLRTPVYFKSVTRTTNENGYPIDTEANVFGEDAAVYCKWVNAHGTEVMTAVELDIKEPATITMRYSPLIVPTLIVYRKSDAEPYEIISIDDVEQRHIWLEVKVRRRTPAR
jgi:hypothetical protein